MPFLECSVGSSFEVGTGDSLSGDSTQDALSFEFESAPLACDDDDDDDALNSSSVGAAFEGNGTGDDDSCKLKFEDSIVRSLLITALAVPVPSLPFIVEVVAATVFQMTRVVLD